MKYFHVFVLVIFACFFYANNTLLASGTITGYVWEDENVNGHLEEGEPTFDNVPIFLFTCSGQYVDAILTDQNGFYQFENIANNSYRIFVSTAGLSGQFSFTIIDSETYNQIQDTGYSECFDINDADAEIGAGLAILGIVGDKVWEDLNGNGYQESNEPGIPNVLVELYQSGTNILLGSTVTNNVGVYLFYNIIPGSYYIKIVASSVYQKTVHKDSNYSTNSDINDANGDFTSGDFVISATVSNFDIDAGLYRCIKFCGTIYDDINMSDTLDSNENGINGLVVKLWKVIGSDTFLMASTLTAHNPEYSSADGYYQFCVSPGQYFLEIERSSLANLMAGIPFANTASQNYNHFYPYASKLITDDFFASSGESYCDVNNGFFCPGKVTSHIWIDDNHNGIREESEEVLEGVSVHLCNVDGTVVSGTSTDSNGFCSFDAIRPGNYFIKFFIGSTFDYTQPFAGISTVDSDVTGINGTGTTNLLTINSCQIIQNIDAGAAFRALPVHWQDIRGVAMERNNLVSWKVASQVNVSHYAVFKSKTDKLDWTECGKVLANKNTSDASYEFFDNDPLNDLTYYRVTSVDFDGKKQISSIVSVARNIISDLALTPNPSSDVINISYNVDFISSKDWEVQIFAPNGQLIMHKDLNQNGHVSFSVSDLYAGVYQAVLVHNNVKLQSKTFFVVK